MKPELKAKLLLDPRNLGLDLEAFRVWWVPATLGAVVLGLGSAVAPAYLGFGLGALLVVLLILRASDLGAVLVGAYWATFAVKSTIFSEVIIEGLFYPFYFGLAGSVLLSLLRGRLRVVPLFFWVICIFFGFVFFSLLGYTGAVDGLFVQKFIAMAICPIVMLSIQSRHGLGLGALFGGLGGVGVSVWVIVNSALGGFAYRGDVDVNQNVVAFAIGLSLTVTISALISPTPRTGAGTRLLLFFGSTVMAYALLLLASRGMTIALGAAVVAMFIHVAARDARVLRVAVLLAAAAALGVLLPGGDGLLQRFKGESVGSAGDRTPIWSATVAAIEDGNLLNLVLGSGFDGSQKVVKDATGIHTSTHNAYLAMAYDYGAAGLLAFLAMHLVALMWAVGSTNRYATMAIGIVCLLLGANLTTTTPDDFMYWLALGFALACVSVGTVASGTTRSLRASAG